MSPFGKLRMSKNNQIVNSPFEKDSHQRPGVCPYEKGLNNPFVKDSPFVLFKDGYPYPLPILNLFLKKRIP